MKKNWRKKTAAFALIMILIVVNACNFPTIEELGSEPEKKYITFTEVSVTPESGSGDFTLTFSYTRERTGEVSISCYYITPDKNTYGIITVDEKGSSSTGSVTKTKDFSVVKSGEEAASGVYTAVCEDEYGLSKQTTQFTVGDDPTAEVSIVDVKVMEGEKYHYALEYTYVIRIPDQVPFTCNYVAPSGGTYFIDNYTGGGRMNEPINKTMYFSIIPRDGKVEPGTYVATCQDDELRSTKSTNFVVSEEPTPTPTATLTPQPLIREGIIAYDESNEQMTPHLDQWGFFPSQFHKWCNPVLTISPDGTISGSCYNAEDPGDLGCYGTWSGGSYIEGRITGTLEPNGQITFREELTEQYKPNDPSWWEKRVTIIEGTGTFSSTTKANGTATFTAECTAATEVASHCGLDSKYDFFTGTIPWEFTINN